MMIGLVSDTHLPHFGRALPEPLVRHFREARVELILHMGDFVTPLAIELLEAIAPVEGIAGNNDPPEIVERFGRKRIIAAGGARIGLVHGDGMRGTTLERARRTFANDAVDAICFGHSHQPYAVRHGKVWLINPGSPTDKRREARYSFGILRVEDGVLTPVLHSFDRRS